MKKLNLHCSFMPQRWVLGALFMLIATSSGWASDILSSSTDVVASITVNKTIKGSVTDNTGEPIIGANVVVEGTTNGVITDVDGNFVLENVADNATLKVSFIGYKTRLIKVGTSSSLLIRLEDDSETLEEVVVVGYGVQKKVSVSGSISTVGSDKLENRPVMNLSSAIQGLATGVRVTQQSGAPGAENVAIQVRGVTSTNGSSPLVLIDGTPGDMTVLNSEDVESISILKDAAAAAIYGSRAGAGVILVTTKKGRNEKPRVTFSALFAQTKPMTDLSFMSSTADWMHLHNVAKRNANPTSSSDDYAQSSIDAWREADKNPNGMYTNSDGVQIPNWLAFPNTDWAQVLFQPNHYQKYNMSVQGGNENTTYMLSIGYQNNPGTVRNTGMERFNIRTNVETKIAKIFTLGTQTWMTKEYKDPGSVSMTYLMQAFPGITPEYQGKYGASEDPNTTNKDNILQQIAAEGGQNEYTRLNTTWYAIANLGLKGLQGEARFNYNEYFRNDKHYSQLQPRYSFRESLENPKEGNSTLDQATTYRYSYNSRAYTANLLLRYNNTFGKHDVSGLLGYEQYWTESTGFDAQKKGLLDWSVTDITSAAEMVSIGAPTDAELRGYAMISYFGRIGYSYDGKYILELHGREDQSSRFAPGHRGGFFPSGSIAWRISEENFYAPVKPYVNYLKLRASYGSLGNVVSGNYAWQALYGKVNNVFNESIQNGIIQQTQSNLTLSWEKVYTTNVGFEARFLDDRLGLEFEYYNRDTKDMLGDVPMYLTVGNGISSQKANMYEMNNKGLELNLTWNDRIKDFRYSAVLNATYNSNKITKYNGALKYEFDETVNDAFGNSGVWRYTNLADVTTGGDTRRVEGHSIDEWFLQTPYSGSGQYKNADGTVNPKGGPKDGMIRTKADLEWVQQMIAAGYNFSNTKVGPEAANLWYGQVLMNDNNGDGIYGGTDDKVFTGKTTTPKWLFGLSLDAEWKGFDLSMQWAARLGVYGYLNERGANGSHLGNVGDTMPSDAYSLYYSYDAMAAYNDFKELGPAYDPATDSNANINGKYPRLLTSSSSMTNSTFYLYNMSYLKLKSLQIGYTLPKKWIAPSGINNCRVFVAGENLLTIKSSAFRGIDPEVGTSLTVYPISRVLSCGVSVTF
ncbi:SusC/RagA family TonB-linked outer membrane protein [Bacteroides sp. UBA939]|uniref:SusC/RagA family TonB-linked outer membrane protein n=1 Tax=Bacteroides sp. UBA939 TaxID=1946092 RepID=UPI0025BDBC5E|nr:TonB-dependent receptor [Bacteroides sp. UBA939]